MPTTGYTNKNKPFTVPGTFEADKKENIVLTENGKTTGNVIYLGFTKNGGDDCANNINAATRKCQNCGNVNATSSSSCSSCNKPLYYITSDTAGCYGNFSDTQGGQTAGKIVFTLAANPNTAQRTVTYKYGNKELFKVTQKAKQATSYKLYVTGYLVANITNLVVEAPSGDSSVSISRDQTKWFCFAKNGDCINVDIRYNTINSSQRIEFTIESDSDTPFNTSILEDQEGGEKTINIVAENNRSHICGTLLCQAHTGIDFIINITKYCEFPTLEQDLRTDLTFENGDVVHIQWRVGQA